MNRTGGIAVGVLTLYCVLCPARAGNREGGAFEPEDALAVCIQHLQAVGRALEAYQRDHQELPPRLSDLYPKYIGDREVLHCRADASLGGSGKADEPPPVISYHYDMSTAVSPRTFFQLGPRAPADRATWREEKMLQRVQFGDRVPVVTCLQHRPAWDLNLTPTGQVYRSRGDWAFHPDTILVVLERMERDMAAGPAHFNEEWSPSAVESYAAYWINSPLPPALRARLGDVADRLSATARVLPSSQSGVYCLAARFYRAAGQKQQAIAACQEALLLPGRHEEVSLLLADARYRANRKRGTPPVDAYLALEMERRHIPGLSVAVVRDGKVVLATGYGLANVELSVPATKDTVYELASVTKPFTATAILMLVEEGKISLDDSVLKYRPDWPGAWSSITIRHLLTHTSGLPDYLYIPTFHSKSGFAWERDYTLDEFVRVVSQSPLEFQPGDRYAYCNTGYYLLGMIIERVSGKPYAEFVAERIFRPLQMTATRRMDRREIIPNRASGYAWEKNARQNAEYSSATWAYAEGGLVSSVSDLAKWDAALYTEQLLTRSTLEQMFTPAKLNNGEVTGYGFGWYVNTYGSHKRRVSHGGSKPGFSTHIARYADDRLSVIVLANAWGAGADALAQGVAAFYLPVPEPIVDKDPQTTQRLKSVLLGLAAGRADPALFTAEAHAELLPTVQQAQRFYQSLGPLKSFQLVEQKSEEQSRTYRYRSILGETPWTHTFVVTKTGKIAEVRAAPE